MSEGEIVGFVVGGTYLITLSVGGIVGLCFAALSLRKVKKGSS